MPFLDARGRRGLLFLEGAGSVMEDPIQQAYDHAVRLLEADEEACGRAIDAAIAGSSGGLGLGLAGSGERLPDHVLDDLGLVGWAARKARLRVGAWAMDSLFRAPLPVRTEELEDRQARLRAVAPHLPRARALLAGLRTIEPDVLWLLQAPTRLDQAWPMPLVCFTWKWFRGLNALPGLLDAMHLYRIWAAPLLQVLLPLTMFLAPWWYLRKNLGMKISLKRYLGILWSALRVALRPTGNPTIDGARYGTLAVYAGMFVGGLMQALEVRRMTRYVRAELLRKQRSLARFIDAYGELRRLCHGALDGPMVQFPAIPSIPGFSKLPSVSAILTWWTSQDVRGMLAEAVRQVALIDVYTTIAYTTARPAWCVPVYADNGDTTSYWGMGHPLLGDDQVRNPARLGKSLIMTGPNAAGKTTYLKAICANQVLAQVWGRVCALRADVVPVHTIGTFVRVADDLGTSSLFEAEVRRCVGFLREAEKVVAKGGRALYLLDEPMHSTPPTEGTATAMAIFAHLGRMPGVRILATTHYHAIPRLAEEHPDLFANVSMEAEELGAAGGFRFPFRVRAGPSFQCIALELLPIEDIPSEVLEGALKYKKILCGRGVAENHAP